MRVLDWRLYCHERVRPGVHGREGAAAKQASVRFLACEGNDLMTVFDLRGHKSVAFVATASGLDVTKYDPGLRRVYVACGSGAISIYEIDDAAQARKLEDFPVQKRVQEQEDDGVPVARMVVYEAVGTR
jgi:hypothetical protein